MSVLSVYYTGSRSRHKNVICIKITFHFFAIQSTLHYQRLYFFLETLSLMLRLQEGPAIKLNHSGGHKKKSPNSARIKNSILVLLLLIEKVTLGPGSTPFCRGVKNLKYLYFATFQRYNF